MQDKVKEGAPYEIRLAHPVPVIWVYLTGWSNGDGAANFRDDVYGLDTVGDAIASAARQAAPRARRVDRAPLVVSRPRWPPRGPTLPPRPPSPPRRCRRRRSRGAG